MSTSNMRPVIYTYLNLLRLTALFAAFLFPSLAVESLLPSDIPFYTYVSSFIIIVFITFYNRFTNAYFYKDHNPYTSIFSSKPAVFFSRFLKFEAFDSTSFPFLMLMEFSAFAVGGGHFNDDGSRSFGIWNKVIAHSGIVIWGIYIADKVVKTFRMKEDRSEGDEESQSNTSASGPNVIVELEKVGEIDEKEESQAEKSET